MKRETDKGVFMAGADVLIQAGHEGRLVGATGAEAHGLRERDLTPVVADTATQLLEQAGVNVIRRKAHLAGTNDRVAIAVACHFDGGNGSGASVGYNDPTDAPAAKEWKSLYGRYWPYRWMPDNFTRNLSGYYGFRHWKTTDAEFVIEFGSLGNEAQAEWLAPRLKWLGRLLAHYLDRRLGHDTIPDPGPYSELPAPQADDIEGRLLRLEERVTALERR